MERVEGEYDKLVFYVHPDGKPETLRQIVGMELVSDYFDLMNYLVLMRINLLKMFVKQVKMMFLAIIVRMRLLMSLKNRILRSNNGLH
jgi:hypothetical protein